MGRLVLLTRPGRGTMFCWISLFLGVNYGYYRGMNSAVNRFGKILIGGYASLWLGIGSVQAGYWGGALKFDGVNSYAWVPLFTNAPTGNAPYTQEFWMKINGWPTYATGINGFVLSRGGEGPSRGNHMILWHQHLGVTHWNPDSDTQVQVESGRWYHFAATWDGHTERVYLDGLLVWSQDWSPFNVDGGSVTFGQHDNVGGYRFQGELDEVRIWNYARSAETIRADFRRKVAPDTPGLLAYWQFDENAGQTLTDSSPAHNHGSLGSSDAVEPEDPARVESTVPVSFGDGLLIGYPEVAALSPLSTAQMVKLQQLSWFFAHASVGGNIVDGLSDLNALSSSPFPLAPVAADDTPPAATQPGVVYEFSRGNPGWQAKVDDLVNDVNHGWREPSVNLVLNKLCFIDQDADVNYYLRSQAALEAAYPTTIFVYATMPLTTEADEDNYRRNLYNDALREWVAANNKVLLDIADLEAHDPKGVAQTFMYNGRTCQKLYAGFTTDGGHLDDPTGAGRRQVAKGFYALAVALMNTDRDQDGVRDFDELIAGTDPLSDATVLRLSVRATSAAGEVVFSWPSSSNRVYQLEYAASLKDTWQKQGAEIPAAPPLNHRTNTPGSGSYFYRLGVRR